MRTSHLTQLNEKALLKAIEIEGWPQALRRQSVFARFYCSLSLSLLLSCCYLDGWTQARNQMTQESQKELLAFPSLSSADEEEGLWQKLNDKGILEFSLCNTSAWQGSVKWQGVSPSPAQFQSWSSLESGRDGVIQASDMSEIPNASRQ